MNILIKDLSRLNSVVYDIRNSKQLGKYTLRSDSWDKDKFYEINNYIDSTGIYKSVLRLAWTAKSWGGGGSKLN
jgi:hypothetical protein